MTMRLSKVLLPLGSGNRAQAWDAARWMWLGAICKASRPVTQAWWSRF